MRVFTGLILATLLAALTGCGAPATGLDATGTEAKPGLSIMLGGELLRNDEFKEKLGDDPYAAGVVADFTISRKWNATFEVGGTVAYELHDGPDNDDELDYGFLIYQGNAGLRFYGRDKGTNAWGYFGVGVLFNQIDVRFQDDVTGEDSDDQDETFGGYARVGALWAFLPNGRFGIDVLWRFGTSFEFEEGLEDGNIDGTQIMLFTGLNF